MWVRIKKPSRVSLVFLFRTSQTWNLGSGLGLNGILMRCTGKKVLQVTIEKSNGVPRVCDARMHARSRALLRTLVDFTSAAEEIGNHRLARLFVQSTSMYVCMCMRTYTLNEVPNDVSAPRGDQSTWFVHRVSWIYRLFCQFCTLDTTRKMLVNKSRDTQFLSCFNSLLKNLSIILSSSMIKMRVKNVLKILLLHFITY